MLIRSFIVLPFLPFSSFLLLPCSLSVLLFTCIVAFLDISFSPSFSSAILSLLFSLFPVYFLVLFPYVFFMLLTHIFYLLLLRIFFHYLLCPSISFTNILSKCLYNTLNEHILWKKFSFLFLATIPSIASFIPLHLFSFFFSIFSLLFFSFSPRSELSFSPFVASILVSSINFFLLRKCFKNSYTTTSRSTDMPFSKSSHSSSLPPVIPHAREQPSCFPPLPCTCSFLSLQDQSHTWTLQSSQGPRK